MTTVTIRQDISDIPTEFGTWEELQAYALQQLMVKIYPVEEKNIDNQLKEKTIKLRQKFREDPQSFDNI